MGSTSTISSPIVSHETIPLFQKFGLALNFYKEKCEMNYPVPSYTQYFIVPDRSISIIQGNNLIILALNNCLLLE